MHDENLAVLHLSKFDNVVEDFGIPVSQQTVLISHIVSRAPGSQKKGDHSPHKGHAQ
jgi:hypothetical protein